MRYLVSISIIVLGLLAAGYMFTQPFTAVMYKNESRTLVTDRLPVVDVPSDINPTPVDQRPVVQHVPLPDQVKAIYMSACVAGTPSFRSDLIELIEATELNAVMIDIKDYSGTIAFAPATTSPWYSAWSAAECGARDMREFIADLHDRDIFVIGRITVFQDPLLANQRPEWAVKRADGVTVWRDHKGLSFIEVAAKPYWDRIVDLTVESYNLGFDEINYDYIRFPSDGNMQDISFPLAVAGEHGQDKQANLEAFFAYLYEQVSDPSQFAAVRHENTGRDESIPWTSADLFGMTTSNYDDLSIGQVQERAAPYFDFIAPMVYPSHYPAGFLNGRNPNEYPYEVVYNAMSDGVGRMTASTTTLVGFKHEPIMANNASGTPVFTGQYTKPVYTADKFRTWIQDFDYGGDYDAADVRAQIQASYDAGVDSWMIWAPSNRYTRAALESAPVQLHSTTSVQSVP